MFLLVFPINILSRLPFPRITSYNVCYTKLLRVVGFWMYRLGKSEISASQPILDDHNPLEFKVAIVFSLLYVLFSIITQFSITHFGQQGLNGLSVIVGFTDIDPFLLNLFQGHYEVSTHALLAATLQAIIGNNIIKLRNNFV